MQKLIDEMRVRLGQLQQARTLLQTQVGELEEILENRKFDLIATNGAIQELDNWIGVAEQCQCEELEEANVKKAPTNGKRR